MKVVIVGAGMSGLSVGFMLNRRGFDVEVLESVSAPGGASHSFEWHGHTCDWATHRLFTHNDHTLQQLLSLVPMNRIERTSRVYLGGKWLKDPVDVIQLATRFFPAKTFSIPATYLARPRHLPEDSFQNYVYARFGRALGDFLFSPYTVKMFGIPANEISVEWARKKVRIAGPLDVIRQGSKKKFNYFYYPKEGGYGAIPNRLYSEIRDRVILDAEVTSLDVADGRVTGVRYRQNGVEKRARGDLVVSTIPLTELCRMLGHESTLTYRPVSAVNLFLKKPQASPNHWIYYMDGDMVINRLCEFKNFDPNSGPPDSTVICAEVTDNQHADLVSRTVQDLARSGLIDRDDVADAKVVTRDFSYPVYRCNYEADVDAAQKFLGGFRGLRWVGRAAQFEHLEVDDCFTAALQLAKEIVAEQERPVAVATEKKRSGLPVEPRVAAVVSSSGDAEHTTSCLDSLAASDYKHMDIVLVTDPTEEELRKRVAERWPRLGVLTKPEGMGIPAAFNLGCNWAARQGADFIFLCLGRTTVEPDTLSGLVGTALRDPEAGILTPKILDFDRREHVWSIGAQFRKFPPSTKSIGLGQRDDERFAVTREVEFAVSSGLLVTRRVLEESGLFDPGYQFYYEDIDFSKRAREKGFRVRYVPEARMYYRELQDAERSQAFYLTWGRSFSRYYRRHMKPFAIALPLHLSYLVLREALTGNAGNVPALLKGVVSGLHQRMGEIPRLDEEFMETL